MHPSEPLLRDGDKTVISCDSPSDWDLTEAYFPVAYKFPEKESPQVVQGCGALHV